MAVKKHHRLSVLIVLFLFSAITLSIHFLHTESSIQGNHNCPACHFQNSTIATQQANVFHLPQLMLLEMLKTFEAFHYNSLCFVNATSRSPPNI